VARQLLGLTGNTFPMGDALIAIPYTPMRTKYFWLMAIMLGSPAGAEQWFTVASPGLDTTGTRVDVDVDSVRAGGQEGGGIIRVTFDVPQMHIAGFRYRSFTAGAQFDCQRRNINLASAVYFAEPAATGLRVGADSPSREARALPGLLERIPGAARRALLKATCATSQPAS
jgi:hypothetical protein